MGEKLLYLNGDTGVDTSDYNGCIHFIEQRLISVLKENLQKANDCKPIHVISFSKNSNIKASVDRLLQLSTSGTDLIVVTYGPHVQKMLSIIEIFKSTEATAGGKPLKQFNKLDTFVSVKPGRNELLDSRSNVPILTVVFTHSNANGISGFTKQI